MFYAPAHAVAWLDIIIVSSQSLLQLAGYYYSVQSVAIAPGWTLL